MDTVSIIEAALVAGAAASAKDTTSQAVKDAYTGLKKLLVRLFAEKPHAQVIIEEHETDPETYEKPLKKLLIEAHADQDADLLAAAEHVMTLVQPQQVGMGKYTIQNTATVQAQNIGDNQQITQYFGASSSSQLEQRDRDVFKKLEKMMPELLEEMRQDLGQYPLRREFVLLKKSWSYWPGGNELCYYYDDYNDLDGMISILRNYNLIKDITFNNVKRYVILETLADYLTD